MTPRRYHEHRRRVVEAQLRAYLKAAGCTTRAKRRAAAERAARGAR